MHLAHLSTLLSGSKFSKKNSFLKAIGAYIHLNFDICKSRDIEECFLEFGAPFI